MTHPPTVLAKNQKDFHRFPMPFRVAPPHMPVCTKLDDTKRRPRLEPILRETELQLCAERIYDLQSVRSLDQEPILS